MATKRDPRKRGLPRRPEGPLTGPRFQLARAMVGEHYAALRRGEGVCCLCARRRATSLAETKLTPDQARRAGMTRRKHAFVQQGVCDVCQADPDIEARLDADIEKTLDDRRAVPLFDLGDLDWPDVAEAPA